MGCCFFYHLGGSVATITKIKSGPEPDSGIFFDGKKVEIDENLTYTFENEVGRIIRVRWIGTERETKLPIWELSVQRNYFESFLCSDVIVIGYGTWTYTKGEFGGIDIICRLELGISERIAA